MKNRNKIFLIFLFISDTKMLFFSQPMIKKYENDIGEAHKHDYGGITCNIKEFNFVVVVDKIFQKKTILGHFEPLYPFWD